MGRGQETVSCVVAGFATELCDRNAMASTKLGSKSDIFLLDSQTWLCSSGLPCDIIIEVGDMSFRLHKFPLLSRSGLLETLIEEIFFEEGRMGILQLHDIPGGAETFLLVAKFCYSIRFEVNSFNIVSLRCAAEYLQMNESFGENNLILQTENFLDEVIGNWSDSFKALECCQEVLPHAEELHIVSRCIDSLAIKACSDQSLFSWPVSEQMTAANSGSNLLWNGIQSSSGPLPVGGDWWYQDASSLKCPFYRRFIHAAEVRRMKPERIAGSLMFYAKKYLPIMGRQSGFQSSMHSTSGSSSSSSPSEIDQRFLLEEIVDLFPDQKGVAPTKFLLRLLRTSMILHAKPTCQENLEKRIGAQLDEAALEDLLIPNMGYSAETLYDIDCVHRILDQFMHLDKDTNDFTSTSLGDDGHMTGAAHTLTPVTMVANLVDGYLAEVAPDVNLKLPKFQSLATVIPDYARLLDDGIYRAIDIYLKAHPWLTDSEKEQICRLMNCQKLSLEASTHAAQNQRLPLRVIVQVLFFEQLRLRTSIAGWIFVSDNLENSQNLTSNMVLARNECCAQLGPDQDHIGAADEMRERVSDLEKECLNMKQVLEKMVKNKSSWNLFLKRLGLKLKSRSADAKESKPYVLKAEVAVAAEAVSPSSKVSNKESHENGK